MMKIIKKHQRALLVILIAICMAIILLGGIRYISTLRHNLQDHAIQNVMTVTTQQQQAFDNFIFEDQKRLHSYADFFSQYTQSEDIPQPLTMFHEVDAIFSVMCLDDGWFCSSVSDTVRQVDEGKLDYYREFDGSGVRDSFVGLFSGSLKFGYYETFTFSNGHKGLIQKTYDRAKVSETFSLSFYNDQGLSHIVNQDGDILLRPAAITENLYDNIFDALNETSGQQEDIDRFMEALHNRETGSMIFSRNGGSQLVYTYVPVEHVDGWFLVSVVSLNAIKAENNQMLQDSQTVLGLLIIILIICAIFVLLIWRTHKDIEGKEQEAAYQTQMFDILTTYLSRNTDDVYIMYNHDTEELEYVSPNVERVLGIKTEELTNYFRTSDMAADSEGTKAYYAEVQALVPGQTARSRNTERVNPQTGECKYFLENAYCASIQGQNKRVAYLSDRTKERKAQDNLAEALRMAQAANHAKSAFLSSVSHDIRTPMNAIIGFLALIQDEANNPAMVVEYAQRIDAASQHLLGLINDVLDMNKIESGSATLNLSDISLAEIIDEINSIIRPQTKAKDQTFDIFVSHLVYEHLQGDKLRINQILINILSNAVKYTPEGGSIEMRVEELPQVVTNYSRVLFTISDNGLGMSEDYQKVIFDPFTREDVAIANQIQGTGLGMAITKSLVDLMGGTIHVESKLGEGSTFTVELELAIQEKEDDPEFWTHHNVTRMIVADDNEEVCRNIVKTMAQAGVVTDYSTDGETAIQMMRSAREAGRPYDLILLDWKMPKLNGLETARLIRKNYPDRIPILLLTAYDWSEIEQEALEIGVNHFMPKPFFMSTFKEAIRRVMGRLERTQGGLQSDAVEGKRILVVDDIEVNRIILVKLLSAQGAICDVAENGQDALEKFLKNPYDLIIMDVQMPVMDGYAATRAIRGSDHPEAKRIPIIAMTANAFVDDVRNALESGMDAHIAKPVQLDKLKSTIQQVLDNRQNQG